MIPSPAELTWIGWENSALNLKLCLDDAPIFSAMGDKTEQEMAKEKILDVKPSPGDAEVKVHEPLNPKPKAPQTCTQLYL